MTENDTERGKFKSQRLQYIIQDMAHLFFVKYWGFWLIAGLRHRYNAFHIRGPCSSAVGASQ